MAVELSTALPQRLSQVVQYSALSQSGKILNWNGKRDLFPIWVESIHVFTRKSDISCRIFLYAL